MKLNAKSNQEFLFEILGRKKGKRKIIGEL